MQGMASTRGERGSASCRSRSPPTPAAGSQDSFRRPLWFPPALTDCRFGQPTSFSPTFPSKERCTPRVMCSTLPYIRATPWRCSRCSEAPERELRCVWGESLGVPALCNATKRRENPAQVVRSAPWTVNGQQRSLEWRALPASRRNSYALAPRCQRPDFGLSACVPYHPNGGRERTAFRLMVKAMTKLRFVLLLLLAAIIAASLAAHHPIGMNDGGYW
jgi:hypothetical protein